MSKREEIKQLLDRLKESSDEMLKTEATIVKLLNQYSEQRALISASISTLLSSVEAEN